MNVEGDHCLKNKCCERYRTRRKTSRDHSRQKKINGKNDSLVVIVEKVSHCVSWRVHSWVRNSVDVGDAEATGRPTRRRSLPAPVAVEAGPRRTGAGAGPPHRSTPVLRSDASDAAVGVRAGAEFQEEACLIGFLGQRWRLSVDMHEKHSRGSTFFPPIYDSFVNDSLYIINMFLLSFNIEASHFLPVNM